MVEIHGSFDHLKKDILARRATCRDELSKLRKSYKQYREVQKQLTDATSSEDRARLAEVDAQLLLHVRKLNAWRALKKKLDVQVTQILPVRYFVSPSEVLYFNGVLVLAFKKKLRGCQLSTMIDKNGQLVINYRSTHGLGTLTLAPLSLYGTIFTDYEDYCIPTLVSCEQGGAVPC